VDATVSPTLETGSFPLLPDTEQYSLSPVHDKGSPECKSIGSTVFVQEVEIPSQRKKSQHPGVAIPRNLIFGVRKALARCVDSTDGVKVDNAESVGHKKSNKISYEGSLALSDSVKVEVTESIRRDRAEQNLNDMYYKMSSLFTPASTDCIAADGKSMSAKTALTSAAVQEGQTDQPRTKPGVLSSTTADPFPVSDWNHVTHKRKPKFRKAGDPLVGRSLLAQVNHPVCREYH
jgi:hypothetical protein